MPPTPSEENLNLPADLLRMLAEDIRDPLRRIILLADRIRTLPSEGACDAEYVSRIHKNAWRIQEHLDNLVSLYEPEGSLTTPVDLNRVVADVQDTLREDLVASQAVIMYGDLPRLFGNPAHLRRVFRALLSNAIKFRAKTRRPIIRITHATTSLGGLELKIEDNGIGFAPENAEKIFLPFQTLNRSANPEGMGIGLAVCRKILGEYGGSITAQGNPGRGAVFNVILNAGSSGDRKQDQASSRQDSGVPS